MRSFPVAPPERLSRSRNLALLVPFRAPVALLGDLADFGPLLAFFARVALVADLPLDGATCRPCAATFGLLAGVGSPAGAPASLLTSFSGITFIMLSPSAVITATTTSITQVPPDCKQILPGIRMVQARAKRRRVRPPDRGRWWQMLGDR